MSIMVGKEQWKVGRFECGEREKERKTKVKRRVKWRSKQRGASEGKRMRLMGSEEKKRNEEMKPSGR